MGGLPSPQPLPLYLEKGVRTVENNYRTIELLHNYLLVTVKHVNRTDAPSMLDYRVDTGKLVLMTPWVDARVSDIFECQALLKILSWLEKD